MLGTMPEIVRLTFRGYEICGRDGQGRFDIISIGQCCPPMVSRNKVEGQIVHAQILVMRIVVLL